MSDKDNGEKDKLETMKKRSICKCSPKERKGGTGAK